jgi:predicted AlkP superfamily pyrophosphatase or phosphodiesterase
LLLIVVDKLIINIYKTIFANTREYERSNTTSFARAFADVPTTTDSIVSFVNRFADFV